MRSFLISAASVGGLLLLLCALASGPATAQISCTVTYDCQGNSGCIGVMESNVSQRTITSFASQSACDSAAAAQRGLPTMKCSCGGGTAPTSDLGGQMGQLISTMTPQQQMGVAAGAVGTLMIVKGLSELMSGPQVSPAQQQRNLAAKQLNNSGVYLMKQKNYSGAINEFQQALAQTPNDSNIKNNLAAAKQAQQNGVIAGKTSGALGQLLGTGPTAGPEIASNGSPLSMVNLNNPGTSELRPPGEAPAPDQSSLQSQIDGALGNAPAAAPANPAQAQSIDQIFNPSQAAEAPAPPPAPPQAQIDAEKSQVDDLFKSGGSTPASAQLVQQASSGQAAANAASPEEASAGARAGFDTGGAGAMTTGAVVPAPSVATPSATATAASAPQVAASANPSGLTQQPAVQQPVAAANAPMVMANLKTPPAPAPEYPITPMPERVTSGAAAPGSPIFDCKGDRTLIKRLESGLPAQDEAIRRTEEAMKAAKEDSEKAHEEMQEAAVSTMLASAGTAATWAQTGIAKIGALRSNGFGPEVAHFKLLAQMKEVLDETETLQDLLNKPAKSYKAGYAYSNAIEVEKTAKSLEEKLEATEKFMKDSGIRDQLLEEEAAELALIAGGPVGGLVAEGVVHTFVAAVDLYTNEMQSRRSAAQAEQAERDLTVMHDQQLRVRGRIYELQQEVVTECANTRTAGY